jgi:mono/diheme cytochrome c family protein
MRARLLVAVLGVLAGMAFDAGPALGGHEGLSVLLPGSPLEGSRLFASKGCIGCHAVHGAGGTAGPDLGRGILKRPLLEIAAVMWNHTPGMEHQFQEKRLTRPTFEPAEMASLLAFLYYLGSLDPPGDADRGAVLFRQKGCQTCHTLGGQGGRVGPDLTAYSRYASPLFLTAGLWRRGRAMASVMEREKVTRATFEGSDIPDLLAYIRSGGSGTERVYAPPGSPKRGETLFVQKRCVECHSVRGHGAKVGPDLATGIKGSLAQIAGAMWNHGPQMWAKMDERGIAVPSLDTQEMSDLIGYLYFLQFIDPPGDARRGAAVYKEKRCGRCHGSAGTRLVAPALAGVVEKLKTPLAVITAMWNHAGQMTETTVEENVVWPVLKGGEMADLMAYLFGGPRADGSTSPARAPRPSQARKDAAPAK